MPVDGAVDHTKVTAHGPGLEPVNCRANVAQTFKVDATKSGKAPLGVEVRSEKGKKTPGSLKLTLTAFSKMLLVVFSVAF